MKKLLALLTILTVTIGTVRADTGPQGPKGDKGDRGEQGQSGQNGHDGNNGHDGQNGQKGSDGSNGHDGNNGHDGSTGENGKDGKNGKDGVTPPAPDNLEHRLNVNLGFDVRWYDWKYVVLKSGYRFDTNHKGHVVDALVVQFKIGKSHEERELDKLRREIQELRYQATVPFVIE